MWQPTLAPLYVAEQYPPVAGEDPFKLLNQPLGSLPNPYPKFFNLVQLGCDIASLRPPRHRRRVGGAQIREVRELGPGLTNGTSVSPWHALAPWLHLPQSRHPSWPWRKSPSGEANPKRLSRSQRLQLIGQKSAAFTPFRVYLRGRGEKKKKRSTETCLVQNIHIASYRIF